MTPSGTYEAMEDRESVVPVGGDGVEVRLIATDWEIRHSGRPDESFTVRGYPAVFGQKSHDLGGFTEILDPQAFDAVLASQPDVHFAWDHDTRYVGARTRNGTLTLRTDAIGLHMDAQVGNYSWAKDLRTALERGDIDQGSFKFHVAPGGDTWEAQDEGTIVRTIGANGIDGLYDVTVTAQGAYPQTSVAAVRSLAAFRDLGRLETEAELVAPEEGEASSHTGDDPEFARRKADLHARVHLHRSELTALEERLGKL